MCNILASGSQEEPFDRQARNASLLYTFPQWSAGLRRARPLGFPTMLLATGRRPPSMNKGGMWPECGSDRQDGGRESRTREHGQGKGGEKGSAQRAAESL